MSHLVATCVTAPYSIITNTTASPNYITHGYSTLSQPDATANLTASDVIIDGVSMKDLINQINKRLLIIAPDLAKLEKYEALRNAYDQYKLVEALLIEGSK